MDQGPLPTPSQLNLVGSFDEQIIEIMENVRLSKNEVEHLKILFSQLERALYKVWRGCKVQPFGSIITGLGIKSSDVDCYVEVPEQFISSDNIYVLEARNMLRRQPLLFRNSFAITSAKVPIVKFYHIPTNRHCDVSFKSPSGVRNSHLITRLLQSDHIALPLAILIKYWSKVHQLTGTNLLPNYALTMMVIFYLQQLDLVPSVASLQENLQPYMVDNWDTAFEPTNEKTEYCKSFYDVVGGFFKFYSTFKFEDNIISPFVGRPISRDLFKTLDSVPDEFILYKENVNNEICTPLKMDTMFCVQDPFEHNKNCAACVHPKLGLSLISYFQLAAKVFEDCSQSMFLKEMLVRKPPPIKLNQKQLGAPRPTSSKAEATNPNNADRIATNNNKIAKPKHKKRTNNVELLYKQYVNVKKGKS